MGDGRTSRPEIIGIEIGSALVRGARIDADRNEVVAVGELPVGVDGLDDDGVIEPSVVGVAIDSLLHRLGVADRSEAQVGLTIGPRNAGVGSGPAMPDWLRSQAGRLEHPLVCSGGLGVAFVPIRSVDQAVKTAFDIGVQLARVDLAPVAAARAIGEQVDDLVCVGSGRGWQARMRDFEVLEAMENPRIGTDEPACVVGAEGRRAIGRYGWIDVAPELMRTQRLDTGRMATAVGAAIGVLYESPANLLDGRVIGVPDQPNPTEERERLEVRSTTTAERTLQLNIVPQSVSPVEHRPAVASAAPAADGPAASALTASSSGPGSASRTTAAVVERPVERPTETVGEATRATSAGSSWTDDRLDENDPINLFSPEGDESTILGKRRIGGWPVVLFMVLVVLAIGLGAAYLFG